LRLILKISFLSFQLAWIAAPSSGLVVQMAQHTPELIDIDVPAAEIERQDCRVHSGSASFQLVSA